MAALNVGEGDSWVQHNRGGRGGSEGDGSTGAVDLEFELEHVHTELRNFLQKKRARKLGAGGEGGGPCKGIGPQQDVSFTYFVMICAVFAFKKMIVVASYYPGAVCVDTMACMM